VIDLHCHVLAGIDDGPADMEGSLALVGAAAATGMRTMVSTPHVSRRFRNESSGIRAKVDELNERLAAEGIEVSVLAGAEVSIGRAAELDAQELEQLRLGGGEWLLLEPPFTPLASGLDILLLDLQRRGHRIVIAHPERCPGFQRDPAMLQTLVREGMLTSITAGSLVGRFGGEVRRFAMELIAEGLVHNVASDTHDLKARPPGIASAIDRCGLGEMADWWTCEVPEAILTGGPIPVRPAVELPELNARRRWRWPRLARTS
jgi:protein-tyrosine phosphatase